MDNSAATKKYVDDNIGGGGSTKTLSQINNDYPMSVGDTLDLSIATVKVATPSIIDLESVTNVAYILESTATGYIANKISDTITSTPITSLGSGVAGGVLDLAGSLGVSLVGGLLGGILASGAGSMIDSETTVPSTSSVKSYVEG
jgi:hypothetical protein